MIEQFVGKVGTKGLLVRGRQILMVRAEKETTWDLPGGRIHVGESAGKALQREMHEELGVDVIVGQFVHSSQVVHTYDQTNQLFLTFLVAVVGPWIFRIPTEEVAEIRWVSEEDLADLATYENCRLALESFWQSHGTP